MGLVWLTSSVVFTLIYFRTNFGVFSRLFAYNIGALAVTLFQVLFFRYAIQSGVLSEAQSKGSVCQLWSSTTDSVDREHDRTIRCGDPAVERSEPEEDQESDIHNSHFVDDHIDTAGGIVFVAGPED